MTALLLLLPTLVAGAKIGQSPVLIDRIAVVAGKRAIKLSDIDRELRVTEFINKQPVNLSSAARREAAGRLVDQEIIREELSAQGYSRATDADADTLMKQIARDRFHGSEAQLKAALLQYGITPDQFHKQLLWQLTVLQFIDQRFRPGVLVSDDDVRAYYDQHLSELKRQYPHDNSFEALSDKIKSLLTSQRVDAEFESWLSGARKRMRVEYKEAAFQ